MLGRVKKFLKDSLGSILGALAATAAGLLLLNPFWNFGLGRIFIRQSYDLFYRPANSLDWWRFNHLETGNPHTPLSQAMVDNVVLVYMDEESYDNLKQPYTGMWDRALHAKLLRRLKADGARAAVFDIVFNDEGTDTNANVEFAAALKDFGNAVLAADKTRFARARYGVGAAFAVTPPLDMFIDAAAGLGTAELNADDDLMVRKHTRIDVKNDQIMPMSWAAAEMLGASFTKNEAEKLRERWVDYYGPPGFLPNVPYFRAIDPTEIKPGYFKNKVVFVGARTFTKTAGERKDEYPSPYYFAATDTGEFMPGVEVQATLFLNLMQENWLHRIAPNHEFWIVLGAGLLFGIGLAQLRPRRAAFAAIVGILFVAIGSYAIIVENRHWFAWTIVVTQILIAWIVTGAYNYYLSFKQRLVLHQQLGMYVSPALARRVEKTGDVFKQGAEKRQVTILFSDIANFTSMSEGMDTSELQRVMNQYFENAVSKCIQPTDGMVIKFIGDAIFALWNTPLIAQADHQERACKTALLFREYGIPPAQIPEGLEVRTRIGLHSGEADVGNFGSTKRVDYTAFGENINLSSRMEGLNKYLGSSILITGDVEKAVRGKFVTRFLGKFILKGFEKIVDVYELLGFPEEAEKSRARREAFAEALDYFQKKDFDNAERLFRCMLEVDPKEGPPKFFLKVIAELRQNPPDSEWQGEIELKEK